MPRFYEKLHEGILEQLGRARGFRRRLIDAALATGREWSTEKSSDRRPSPALRLRHAVLDRLVLHRIRAGLGGDIKWMISGSAAAPAWVLKFFDGIGIPILEAYGLTENPVPIAANRPHDYRIGSVGRPFRINQVRLSEDSEVLVKGPAMFRRYLDQEIPPERLTPDGYYRTGDYGRFDSDGFLYLTGRVADVIKTSTGRRISPAAVEGVYRQSRYIDQIAVVGSERPYLAALIVLNRPAVEAALAGTVNQVAPEADLSKPEDVFDLLNRDIEALGNSLASHERVRRFAILPAPFTIEDGTLTATLKLRRDRIRERYADLIDRLYEQQAAQTVVS